MSPCKKNLWALPYFCNWKSCVSIHLNHWRVNLEAPNAPHKNRESPDFFRKLQAIFLSMKSLITPIRIDSVAWYITFCFWKSMNCEISLGLWVITQNITNKGGRVVANPGLLPLHPRPLRHVQGHFRITRLQTGACVMKVKVQHLHRPHSLSQVLTIATATATPTRCIRFTSLWEFLTQWPQGMGTYFFNYQVYLVPHF